ncbi:MAG: fused MFS/spermidine synthase [Phycisphaerae bacterium]
MCAGFSGAAALIYQVVWNRQFLTLFGSTTAATAAVVAAFMAGIALGAVLLGRYADRLRKPVLVYAGLELTIALYALLFPLLLPTAEAAYAGLWRAALDYPLILNALRLAFGVALLGPPTLAMGATLPLLVRILSPGSAQPFRVVAWMYGVNAIGGAIGAGAAGLLLVPRLGLATTYGGGMALSLASAAIAVLLWWRWHTPSTTTLSGTSPIGSSPPGLAAARSTRMLFPAALLLAGFAAMGYEVIWTRMLVLVTGSSTYAFTLMLVIYVAGLSVGSLWIANRVDRLRSPRLVFAHLQIGVALAATAGLWLFGYFPTLLLSWYRQWGVSFSSALTADAVLAALLMSVPTFLLGAAFPVAVRVARSLHTSTAHETGRVYAWMTSGNVLGVLVVAGVMITETGLQGSLLVLAGISLMAGLLCVATERQVVRAGWGTITAGVLALLAGALVQPRWDPVMTTSGVYKEAPIYLGLAGGGERLRNILGSYRLLYYREGTQAVVSVVERPTLKRTPHRVLAIDGKVDASTGADMSTQVLSGHLPLLLHPSPSQVLIIGLASGVTVGAVEQHTGVEKITVAEIEPAVVEAARQFAPFNHNALADPRLRLVLDDGRHYLGMTNERFDVIISEPSNPWLSGPARLFTREFFQAVREHLNEGGVFAQWLPLYGLSTPLLQAEIRTFLTVFPYAALFQVSDGDLLLVGSTRTLHSSSAVAVPSPVGADLRRVGAGGNDLLARFITGELGLTAWVGDGPTNTDNNALLEFRAPRFLLGDTLATNQSALADAPWQADLANWIAGRDAQSPAMSERAVLLARAYFATRRLDRAEFLARLAPDADEATELVGDIEARRGNWARARRLWKRAGTPAALLKLAGVALTEGNTQVANSFLRRVPEAARGERFHYLQALERMVAEDDTGALRALAQVPVNIGSGWQILAASLRAVLHQRLEHDATTEEAQAQFATLVDELRGQLEHEEGQQTMDELLRDVERYGRQVLTESEYHQLLQILHSRLTEPLAIYYRGVSLLWLGEPARAIAVLEDYLNRLPPRAAQTSYAGTLLEQAEAQNFPKSDNLPSVTR